LTSHRTFGASKFDVETVGDVAASLIRNGISPRHVNMSLSRLDIVDKRFARVCVGQTKNVEYYTSRN